MNSATSLRLSVVLSLLAAVPALVAQDNRTTVRTVAPSTATASRVYQIPGRTEPYEAVSVYTRATGIVRERKFDIGDMVRAGDVLATVDAPEIDRAVESARAAVDQAIAREKNARVLAGRSTNLLGARAISLEESEQRTTTATETEAAVRAARAELARLEELQKFATVRAPFDAVVSARNFDRGDHVRGDAAATDGWLYRVARIDRLRFAINASPDIALRLAVGAEATVRFNEMPGRVFTAQVARFSRVFDTASGTMRVELLLENPDFILPAGLTGTAAFELAPSPGTFVVPTNTLVVDRGRTTIAVVNGGRVAFSEVRPGRNLGPSIEVTSGALAADTAVIVNPNAMLRAGDPVDVLPMGK
ncbi:efflux RND transporter periplasmic adaptor subunit [Termitidicoccus mucosus]|uniref:Efflux transporter periplasmic adaptor subunit n=1 Tax=Termitidicoccus mucosus TaxID=1184151 RepID=A0A178IG85_9BACT|nr:efflux transporter periplasmic adaptor subunit [Opitutaceae bacterium TSB47]